MALTVDRERLSETMDEQAAIGRTEKGELHRLALSDADREVRDWFRDRMEDAGLDVRVDAFGNTFGRREGAEDGEPVLVGSHLDSQPHGGIFDGALGVVGALELVRTLNDEGIETRRPIEIVNWTNEEGSRYQPAMQGSGVWAGALDVEEEYAKTDADGATLEDALERIGYKGDAPAEPAEEYDSYLELHVEQGPYLEENDDDVGVVTGIVGLNWGAVTFHGEADHSGPTPMHARSDALVAAADVITGIRRLPLTLGERTVGTVGHVDVAPNSINVIPGEVTVTWDVRDPDEAVLGEARERIEHEARAAGEREGVDWEVEERMDSPSVDFADRCIDTVETAAEELGYDAQRMRSGAGHDATYAAQVCDAGMVFAVSEGGKSHSKEEYTSPEDCYRAVNTLASAAVRLAEPIG